MIKWASLTACSILMLSNVYAEKSFWCDYKDSFRISSMSHPEISILRAYSDQDIILQVTSPRTFVLRSAPPCKKGFVHLEIVDNQDGRCILDIKDGPWMNQPIVSASCWGMSYIGTQHDSSFSYTISLD